MYDLLIHNCDVLLLNGTKTRIATNQNISVTGKRITSVEPTGEIPSEDTSTIIDGTGLLAIPGLINTHAHVSMVLFRGLVEDV